MKIKICKTCGAENPSTNIECCDCMGDISGIKPVEKTEYVEQPEPLSESIPQTQQKPIQNEVTPGATVREIGNTRLVLVVSSAARNGDSITVKDGDILGREHTGEGLFAAYPTVGRKHAKITCSRGEWTIEDLNSTNGTYINDKDNRLEPGQKYPLSAKDILALSKSCELLVKIEGCK